MDTPSHKNLRHLFAFSDYTWRHWLSLFAFLGAAVFAVISLRYFLSPAFPESRPAFIKDPFGVSVIFFWTLAPPAWFFAEFFVIWAGTTDTHLKRIQDGQKLAQPFWAALLATLLFLIPK